MKNAITRRNAQVARHTTNAHSAGTPPPTFYQMLCDAMVETVASYKYKGKIYVGKIVGVTALGEALVDIVRPHQQIRQYTINFKDLCPATPKQQAQHKNLLPQAAQTQYQLRLN